MGEILQNAVKAKGELKGESIRTPKAIHHVLV